MSLQLDIRRFADSLVEKVKDLPKDKEFMGEVGAFVAEMVRKRTQLGYGVPAEGAARQRLRDLSGGYVGFRRRFRGLSNLTRPKKSNLTLTGDMLGSIGFKVRGPSVTVLFTGQNKRAKMANQKLANIHHSGTRPFMYFTGNEFQRTQQFFRKAFDRRLRSLRRSL